MVGHEDFRTAFHKLLCPKHYRKKQRKSARRVWSIETRHQTSTEDGNDFRMEGMPPESQTSVRNVDDLAESPDSGMGQSDCSPHLSDLFNESLNDRQWDYVIQSVGQQNDFLASQESFKDWMTQLKRTRAHSQSV